MGASGSKASGAMVDTVKTQISKSKIIVYSKTHCPHCTKTKALLNGKKVDFTLVELDTESQGGEMQSALQQISGQRTVPNIFIGGEHLGGNSDLQSADRNGTLDQKI